MTTATTERVTGTRELVHPPSTRGVLRPRQHHLLDTLADSRPSGRRLGAGSGRIRRRGLRSTDGCARRRPNDWAVHLDMGAGDHALESPDWACR